MRYIKITKKEMDGILKADKGWICNVSGNEYVYDFHLSKLPVIIKVASSIRIDSDRAKNKGSDSIKVYAVMKDGLDKKDKIIRGLIKSTRLQRVDGWECRLVKAVLDSIKRASFVYHKHCRSISSRSDF